MDARLCSGFFLDADWTLCYVCIYWINFSSGSGSCEDCARLARIACLGMNSELGSETSRWIGQMAGFFRLSVAGPMYVAISGKPKRLYGLPVNC